MEYNGNSYAEVVVSIASQTPLSRHRLSHYENHNIQTLPTEEQIQDIESLADEVAANLDEFREDFESQRRLVEIFNIQATFKIEDNRG
jgi:hypothetical protein